MKFLADMGISLQTVGWLRRQAHDVVHLREEGLQRLPDDQILDKARKEERVLLTMDLDFGYLLAISQKRLPSVIIFRLNDESATNVNVHLREILSQVSDKLLMGAVISVGENRFRVRSLPIE